MAKPRKRRRLKLFVKPITPASVDSHNHLFPKPLEVRVFTITGQNVAEYSFREFEQLQKHLEANKECKHWIDIEGKSDIPFFIQFGRYFKIHELIMEDVQAVDQHSKIEEVGDYLFMISRMLYLDQDEELINEQVSFFVFDKVLVTIQDEWEDCFNKVRERLKKDKNNMTQESMFYLAYSLIDSIVDSYFPILEKISDQLDEIEDELLSTPSKETLNRIQDIKRKLIVLRKFIRPEREKINQILQFQHLFMNERYRIYLRDTYDHCVQIMDWLESYREVSYSLMDVYLSTINNKMNEVMKVLTVISSIFIPLTFIVGVYGMNFSHMDEKGNITKYNMPELYHPYGYVSVMVFMGLIAIFQLFYFKKKGYI